MSDRPPANASFAVMLDYYCICADISQARLAICARINQPHLNKIANDRIRNVPIDILVNICLALRLSLEESVDLMARRERALSPANALHDHYKQLINVYHNKLVDYTDDQQITNFLLEADNKLKELGLPPLPNADADK